MLLKKSISYFMNIMHKHTLLDFGVISFIATEEDRILRILTRFEIMWLIEHAVMAARLLT